MPEESESLRWRKNLIADGRYDFIETGSLISIKENVEDITLPSEERKIKMYPVDFEEFMVYMKEEILLEYIAECFENMDGTEYLWQGDSKYWDGQAPNLFPYVGRFTNGEYTLNGKPITWTFTVLQRI